MYNYVPIESLSWGSRHTWRLDVEVKVNPKGLPRELCGFSGCGETAQRGIRKRIEKDGVRQGPSPSCIQLVTDRQDPFMNCWAPMIPASGCFSLHMFLYYAASLITHCSPHHPADSDLFESGTHCIPKPTFFMGKDGHKPFDSGAPYFCQRHSATDTA